MDTNPKPLHTINAVQLNFELGGVLGSLRADLERCAVFDHIAPQFKRLCALASEAGLRSMELQRLRQQRRGE